MPISTEFGSMVCAVVEPRRARMEVTATRVEENILMIARIMLIEV